MESKSIAIDLITQQAYNQFVHSFNEASSFSQLTWQITELIKNDTALPSIPIPIQFKNAETENDYAFVKNNYREYAWFFSLQFICSAAEQYFLTPCIALELLKRTEKDGRIKLDDAQCIQNRIIKKSKSKNAWYMLDDYELKVDSNKYFNSIVALRNCVIHRHGKVDKRDTGTASTFKVSWLELNLFMNDKKINSTPFTGNEGEVVSIKSEEKNVEWLPGETIKLSLEDIMNINFTVLQVVTAVHEKVIKEVRRLTDELKASAIRKD